MDNLAWFPSTHDLTGYLEPAVHVEHILPEVASPAVLKNWDLDKSEYSRYVERLGNLALLEQTINTSVSNGDYASKIEAFGESKFLLTKSIFNKPHVGANTQFNKAVEGLVQFATWDSAAIAARQTMLAMLAKSVWEIPDPANSSGAPTGVAIHPTAPET